MTNLREPQAFQRVYHEEVKFLRSRWEKKPTSVLIDRIEELSKQVQNQTELLTRLAKQAREQSSDLYATLDFLHQTQGI